MNKIFDSESPLMRVMSKIFDIGWLSLLYLLFCIPIVTFGAATTSLYYVSAKVLRHNRSYVWREFWSSFKENFAQSTIVWLIMAVLYLLLAWNIQVMGFTDEATASNPYGGYLSGAYLALGVIITCVGSYVFPLISRFRMKLTQILRFSLYCAFRHFLHTLVLLAILVLAGFGLYAAFFTQIVLITLVVPGLAGFLYTFPMEHIMKKYMPKEEKQYDSEGTEMTKWYNE
jgi:uncharacterized membrane protein YesL